MGIMSKGIVADACHILGNSNGTETIHVAKCILSNTGYTRRHDDRRNPGFIKEISGYAFYGFTNNDLTFTTDRT